MKFEIIKGDGRIVQKCPKCNYRSPTVHKYPSKMHLGLKMHLRLTHSIKVKDENEEI